MSHPTTTTTATGEPGLLGTIGRFAREMLAIAQAIGGGNRDENQLTNQVFAARHPERHGAAIGRGDTALAQEWLRIRDTLVRPALLRAAMPQTGDPLDRLRALAGRDVQSTVANASAILEILGGVFQIPWRLPFTLLEHEAGVGQLQDPDGVMQTIASARATVLPALPRPLKLALLRRDATDAASDADLARALAAEFPHSLAVQLAAGTQELATALTRFNGYVALAFVAYNAGIGSAYFVATGHSMPAGGPAADHFSDAGWERACWQGASLLHQPASAVRVAEGVWQCDVNLAHDGASGWWRNFVVRDHSGSRQLIAYQYLRSIRACIRQQPPAAACNVQMHKHRLPGSGPLVCRPTRPGALDKLYDVRKVPEPYRAVAATAPLGLPDDGTPVKVSGGALVAVAHAP